MAQATGSQTRIAVCEESTFGQAPGSPSCEAIYVRGYDVAGRQALLDDDTLRPGVRTQARPDLGKQDVRGTLRTHFAAQDSGLLLKHLMGDIDSSGSGPYTHVLTTGALPTGLTFEKDHGSAISGSGRFMRHHGCRINSGSFGFGRDGYVTADYEIVGASEDPASAALDASVSDNGHTSFTVWRGSYQEGGIAAGELLELSFQYSNDLDAEIYALNDGGARSALPAGSATITGSATFMFDSMDILNKAISGTESSIRATLQRGSGSGSAGNEYAQFDLQQLVYERTAPPIEGPRGLLLTMNFRGYESGLQITLKNDVDI